MPVTTLALGKTRDTVSCCVDDTSKSTSHVGSQIGHDTPEQIVDTDATQDPLGRVVLGA